MNERSAARVVAACGLRFEAQIAERSEKVTAIAGGGDAKSLDRQLRESAAKSASGIISFGLAGALHPSLKAGDVVIGTEVVCDHQVFTAGKAWTEKLVEKISAPASTAAVCAPVFGALMPVVSPMDKAQLYRGSRCHIVDMESLIAARAAADLGLPFAILRVVADDAESAIPKAALAGMREDGSTDALAVIRVLARDVSQTKALIRLAIASKKARASLLGCVGLLGPGLGGIDLG